MEETFGQSMREIRAGEARGLPKSFMPFEGKEKTSRVWRALGREALTAAAVIPYAGYSAGKGIYDAFKGLYDTDALYGYKGSPEQEAAVTNFSMLGLGGGGQETGLRSGLQVTKLGKALMEWAKEPQQLKHLAAPAVARSLITGLKLPPQAYKAIESIRFTPDPSIGGRFIPLGNPSWEDLKNSSRGKGKVLLGPSTRWQTLGHETIHSGQFFPASIWGDLTKAEKDTIRQAFNLNDKIDLHAWRNLRGRDYRKEPFFDIGEAEKISAYRLDPIERAAYAADELLGLLPKLPSMPEGIFRDLVFKNLREANIQTLRDLYKSPDVAVRDLAR